MDYDVPVDTTLPDVKVGQTACNDIPSYGWTGSNCCGDDQNSTNAESFSDKDNGCWQGEFVRNNTIVEVNLFD